jgi:hypothetical protein
MINHMLEVHCKKQQQTSKIGQVFNYIEWKWIDLIK